MDKHWIEAAQQADRKVGVVVGGIAAEMNPTEAVPFICSATVLGPVEEQLYRGDEPIEVWWLDVDLVAGNTLAQMYEEKDILGLWPSWMPHG